MSQPSTQTFSRQDLVAALNDALDVPFITEEVEGQYIDLALGQIIDYVPVAFWPIIADAAKGVDIEVIRKFADAMTRIIVDNIDIKYIPHSMRMALVTNVMNLLVERLQLGMALPKLFPKT
jgi:hypothetical protein